MDSMRTMSWGHSLDMLLQETPAKQGPTTMDERALELKDKLFGFFRDGLDPVNTAPEQGMQVVYDWVVDWLKGQLHMDFPALQRSDDVVAEQALRCHECLRHLADASRQSKDEGQQAQAKLAQAHEAVQKALAAVLQTAAAGPQPPPAVSQRMAVWLKGIKDECDRVQEAADKRLHVALKKLESAVDDLISSCYKIYMQSKPKTEDEMVQEMMKQVEMHMQSLQLSGGPGESGGTGGPMEQD